MREKSIRECGKVSINDIHGERVEEILKGRENEQRRERSRYSNRNGNDNDGGINRLWSKAKGFAASKKKSNLPVRYSKGKDDQTELLKVESSHDDSPRNSVARNSYRTRPYNDSAKKGVFDDI